MLVADRLRVPPWEVPSLPRFWVEAAKAAVEAESAARRPKDEIWVPRT